jgi:hypothetical protein
MKPDSRIPWRPLSKRFFAAASPHLFSLNIKLNINFSRSRAPPNVTSLIKIYECKKIVPHAFRRPVFEPFNDALLRAEEEI